MSKRFEFQLFKAKLLKKWNKRLNNININKIQTMCMEKIISKKIFSVTLV